MGRSLASATINDGRPSNSLSVDMSIHNDSQEANASSSSGTSGVSSDPSMRAGAASDGNAQTIIAQSYPVQMNEDSPNHPSAAPTGGGGGGNDGGSTHAGLNTAGGPFDLLQQRAGFAVRGQQAAMGGGVAAPPEHVSRVEQQASRVIDHDHHHRHQHHAGSVLQDNPSDAAQLHHGCLPSGGSQPAGFASPAAGSFCDEAHQHPAHQQQQRYQAAAGGGGACRPAAGANSDQLLGANEHLPVLNTVNSVVFSHQAEPVQPPFGWHNNLRDPALSAEAEQRCTGGRQLPLLAPWQQPQPLSSRCAVVDRPVCSFSISNDARHSALAQCCEGEQMSSHAQQEPHPAVSSRELPLHQPGAHSGRLHRGSNDHKMAGSSDRGGGPLPRQRALQPAGFSARGGDAATSTHAASAQQQQQPVGCQTGDSPPLHTREADASPKAPPSPALGPAGSASMPPHAYAAHSTTSQALHLSQAPSLRPGPSALGAALISHPHASIFTTASQPARAGEGSTRSGGPAAGGALLHDGVHPYGCAASHPLQHHLGSTQAMSNNVNGAVAAAMSGAAASVSGADDEQPEASEAQNGSIGSGGGEAGAGEGGGGIRHSSVERIDGGIAARAAQAQMNASSSAVQGAQYSSARGRRPGALEDAMPDPYHAAAAAALDNASGSAVHVGGRHGHHRGGFNNPGAADQQAHSAMGNGAYAPDTSMAADSCTPQPHAANSALQHTELADLVCNASLAGRAPSLRTACTANGGQHSNSSLGGRTSSRPAYTAGNGERDNANSYPHNHQHHHHQRDSSSDMLGAPIANQHHQHHQHHGAASALPQVTEIHGTPFYSMPATAAAAQAAFLAQQSLCHQPSRLDSHPPAGSQAAAPPQPSSTCQAAAGSHHAQAAAAPNGNGSVDAYCHADNGHADRGVGNSPGRAVRRAAGAAAAQVHKPQLTVMLTSTNTASLRSHSDAAGGKCSTLEAGEGEGEEGAGDAAMSQQRSGKSGHLGLAGDKSVVTSPSRRARAEGGRRRDTKRRKFSSNSSSMRGQPLSSETRDPDV